MNSVKVFALILCVFVFAQCSSSEDRSQVLVGQLRDDLIKQWPQHEIILKDHFSKLIATLSSKDGSEQALELDQQLRDVAETMVALRQVYSYQLSLKKQIKTLKEMPVQDQQEHNRMLTTANLVYDQVDEHVIRHPFQNFEELQNQTNKAHKKLLSVMTLITPYLSNVNYKKPELSQ